MEFMTWMGEHQIPFCIIFTKADKLKPKALERHIEEYKAEMLETWVEMPPYFITSSSSGLGKEEVLDFIQSINDGFLPHN